MTIDYTKLSVGNIREMIVEDSNGLIDKDDAKEIKPKSRLIAVHQGLLSNSEEVNEDDNIIPEEVEELYENIQELPSPQEIVPLQSDPKWSEYVMSKFIPEELIEDKDGNKNPNIAGLRRVASFLLGDIIESGPVQVWPGTDPNGPGRSSVLYQIVFDTGNVTKIFKALASSWHGNTDNAWCAYGEAIAETRAEGRALRKALGIQNVCADELTKKDTGEIIESYVEKTNDEQDDELIQDAQKNVIQTICTRLGVDIMKFINSGKSGSRYQYIDNVPRRAAAKMIKKLNQYQSSENGSAAIPEEIKTGV